MKNEETVSHTETAKQKRMRERKEWREGGGDKPSIVFEFNLTYRCNAACKYCNRLIDLFHIPNSDVTVSQVEIALAKIKKAYIDTGIRIRKVKFSGGEPMLNKKIQEITAKLVATGFIKKIRILSNGLKTRPQIPGAGWAVDPILEGNDEYKDHQPVLMSPDDYGIRSENCGKKCSTAKFCGSSFEAFGFSFCGIAGALGHLLKINPYSTEPTRELDERICKHCIYSLSDSEQKELQERSVNVYRIRGDEKGGGDLEYPSPTYKKALEEYKKNPTVFPRVFEDAED